MKAIADPSPAHQQFVCPACLSHSRPLWVPWQQHAIGCPVRAAALCRDREVARRAPLIPAAA